MTGGAPETRLSQRRPKVTLFLAKRARMRTYSPVKGLGAGEESTSI